VNLKEWIAGLALAAFSIWVGVQIGIARDWLSAIFLFGFPVAIFLALVLRNRKRQISSKIKIENESHAILRKLDQLEAKLGKLEELDRAVSHLQHSLTQLTKKSQSSNESTPAPQKEKQTP
jgi:uncharacterized membrane protein YgaE (UPF0421/DUF939 family)